MESVSCGVCWLGIVSVGVLASSLVVTIQSYSSVTPAASTSTRSEKQTTSQSDIVQSINSWARIALLLEK